MKHLPAVAILLTSVGTTSCTRHLPPPPAPARLVHVPQELPPRPATEDEGTVIFDVTEGIARVEIVLERAQPDSNPGAFMLQTGSAGPTNTIDGFAAHSKVRLLCETPCAANLTRGQHQLLFTDVDPASGRSSTAVVRVGASPSVLRHSLGEQHEYPGRLVGTVGLATLSLSSLGLGGMLLAFDSFDSEGTGPNTRTAGGIILGTGLVLAIGAVILGYHSRPKLKPGSSTQWVH